MFTLPNYCCHYTLQNETLLKSVTIPQSKTKEMHSSMQQVPSTTETIIVSNTIVESEKFLKMFPASLNACWKPVAVHLDSAQGRRLQEHF